MNRQSGNSRAVSSLVSAAHEQVFQELDRLSDLLKVHKASLGWLASSYKQSCFREVRCFALDDVEDEHEDEEEEAEEVHDEDGDVWCRRGCSHAVDVDLSAEDYDAPDAADDGACRRRCRW